MSIFDRFENAVEKGVNSAFSRVFKSGIKPVDITTAIRKAMDDHVQELSTDRSIAPNHFLVNLAVQDLDALSDDMGGPRTTDGSSGGLDILADELQQEATTYAADQDYQLLGPVQVEFAGLENEMAGQLEVEATTRRGAAAPATAASASPQHPIIDVGGEKWLLTETVTVLGRGNDADITVDDPSVSRRHLELRITPTGVIATDLGSSNGTFVEGHRIDAATLVDGNQIVIGRTPIMFWTHPADEGGA